jgi:hypothetical protein
VLAWSGLLVAAVVVVVVVVVVVYVIFWPVSDRIAKHDVGAITGRGYGAALQQARDAARGRLLAFGAGLFAACALIYTARNFTLSRRTFELTEQGQVTDRFTKTIEQLGSDKLDVRIGGIYALERVARDSAKDHPTVMEVLTAFIREHSREPWPVNGEGEQQGEKKTRPDIQAAVTVVGRRDAQHDRRRIDLSGANLSGANLSGANLAGANLWQRAHREAYDMTVPTGRFFYVLRGADLHGADLSGAILSGADLHGADLSGADLHDADLTGLWNPAVGLTGVDLTDAELTGARWTEGAPVPDLWVLESGSAG